MSVTRDQPGAADPPPPWEPEVVVDRDLARRLIARHVPVWTDLAVEPFGAGWDNTAFLVGGRFVARFPRRTVAARLLEVERRVLPRVSAHLPWSVPDPCWIGVPDDDFPWMWSAYEMLPGRPLADARLDDSACATFARPLGAFLRALHGLELPADVLPEDGLRRLDLDHRVPRCVGALDDLERRGLLEESGPLRAIVDALPRDWRPSPRGVAHGDLHARHLLVDRAGRPCSVIDWGDVHHGDPAVDLAAAHALLPRSAHAAFLEAYGPVDDVSWAVARFRALHVATVVLPYAIAVGDDAFRDAAQSTLARLRVDP